MKRWGIAMVASLAAYAGRRKVNDARDIAVQAASNYVTERLASLRNAVLVLKHERDTMVSWMEREHGVVRDENEPIEDWMARVEASRWVTR